MAFLSRSSGTTRVVPLGGDDKPDAAVARPDRAPSRFGAARAAKSRRAARFAPEAAPEVLLENRDAELIVAVFRTIVLLVALFVPGVFSFWGAYETPQIWLAALAGIYNIATVVACLFPSRFGVRRPFIVIMDAMLITTWIRLSGQFGLFPFYFIPIVVAAMWYRVVGGVLVAIFCDFFYLLLYANAASDPNILPPPFTFEMAITVGLAVLVGCLVGYIAEAQDRERERRLEDQLLVANYQREIDLGTYLQPLLLSQEAVGDENSERALEAKRRLDPRLEFGAAMQSARTVGGGDYFDILTLKDGRTAICIADVSGKSVRAQARLPLLKYSLRALAPLYPEPGPLLAYLNETLAPDLQPELFIGLCYIVFDPAGRTLCYCNAGHISPLLVQGGATDEDERVLALETDGPALGLFPDMLYDARTLPWNPGDQLMLYTDGMVDAFSFGDSEDGETQVRTLAGRLARKSTQSAREVAQGLVDLATTVLNEIAPPTDKSAIRPPLFHKRRPAPKPMRRHRDDVLVIIVRFAHPESDGNGQ